MHACSMCRCTSLRTQRRRNKLASYAPDATSEHRANTLQHALCCANSTPYVKQSIRCAAWHATLRHQLLPPAAVSSRGTHKARRTAHCLPTQVNTEPWRCQTVHVWLASTAENQPKHEQQPTLRQQRTASHNLLHGSFQRITHCHHTAIRLPQPPPFPLIAKLTAALS